MQIWKLEFRLSDQQAETIIDGFRRVGVIADFRREEGATVFFAQERLTKGERHSADSYWDGVCLALSEYKN